MKGGGRAVESLRGPGKFIPGLPRGSPHPPQTIKEERMMGRGTLGEGSGKYIPDPP